MQQRRGTATQWTTADPILAPGEIGFESDTNQFKIGDGINHWSDLSYFKNLEDLGGSLDDYVLISTKGQAGGVASLDEYGLIPSEQIPSLVGLDTEITTAVNNAVSALVDGAPEALNTLNELAAAINDEADFAAAIVSSLGGVEEDLSTHVANTANIHGATGDLVGVDGAQTLTQKTISGAYNTFLDIPQSAVVDLPELTTQANTATGDILTLQGQMSTANDNIATNTSDISDIETNILGLTDDVANFTVSLADKAPLESPNFTGTVAGITKDMVGLENVDNTSDADKPLSDATQTALDLKQDRVAGVTDAEFGYLSGVTSDVQTQIDAKQDKITNVSDTELGYLDGVTSAIQTQLDDKAEATHVHGLSSITDVTATANELNYVTGVTSSVQEQLDDKADAVHAHTVSEIQDITATATELNYVAGVTSSVQDQIDTVNNTANLGYSYAYDLKSVIEVQGTDGQILTKNTGLTPTYEWSTLDLSSKADLAGASFTGDVTLNANPSSALHAATKQYVDNTASGIVAKPQVLGATRVNIDATYYNGTAGVGATLTHNTNGVFPTTAGGAEGWSVGKGILVKNQTNKAHNGRYYISYMGSASTPYVLTRCIYCDEASEIPGAYTFVQDGISAGTGWVQTVADATTFTVGIDDINIVQFSGSGTITAGINISVDGNEVSTVTNPVFDSATIGNVSNTELQYLNGVTSGVQAQLDAKTPELYTFNTTTGTTKTIATADAFKSLRFTDSGAITVTVPTHASDAIPVGSYVELYQWGGQITVVAETPATTSIRSTDSQTKSRTTYSAMVLIKVSENEWLLTGDLTA